MVEWLTERKVIALGGEYPLHSELRRVFRPLCREKAYMFVYRTKIRASDKTTVWRYGVPRDRNHAPLSLTVRVPDDGETVDVFITGLKPDVAVETALGSIKPGETVSFDLAEMSSITAKATRDTFCDCCLFASSK